MKKVITVTFLAFMFMAGSANAGVVRVSAKVAKFSAKHGAHFVKDAAKVAWKISY